MQSILQSVKDSLNVESDYDGFDDQVTVYINSAIFQLRQLGVEITEGFTVTGIEETWEQMYDSVELINGTKDYIFQYVAQSFDPASTSFLLAARERQMLQLSWRLMVEVDPPLEET